jgi:Protein of unknown function (DUF3224)
MLRQVFHLPEMRLDATERNPPAWADVLGGAGLGLGWGIVARIWMRLISTQPGFSIAGTGFILATAIIFGACAGLAFVARRRGWQGWGYYLPRGLVVFFFLPFGTAGGMPLMLTVLLTTLALTRPGVVSLWFLAALTSLVAIGTDIGIPISVAIIVTVGAVALTMWNWLAPRWMDKGSVLRVNIWLRRSVRTLLLLLAAFGLGYVSWEIITDKPGLLAPVYVLFYLLLIYPLFLALRLGLEPKVSR